MDIAWPPDHLDLDTLTELKKVGSQILVPDHFNDRIYNDLTKLGYKLKKINSILIINYLIMYLSDAIQIIIRIVSY